MYQNTDPNQTDGGPYTIMQNDFHRPKIGPTCQLLVALGLAAIAGIVSPAQEPDRSSAQPSPTASAANPAADDPGSHPTPSVTKKEAVAASSLSGSDQGDPRHICSPSVMTNAPVAPSSGSDTNRLRDMSKSAIAFAEIRSTTRSMPDEEFAAYARTLTGKTVTWDGWISNISPRAGGSAECAVDMDEPALATSPNDVSFEFPASETRGPRPLARISFSGRIRNVEKSMDGLHVTLFDVRF